MGSQLPTRKKWSDNLEYGHVLETGPYLQMVLFFSLYERIRHVDPDTQVLTFVNQKTDKLVDLVIPDCSTTDITGVYCDKPFEQGYH